MSTLREFFWLELPAELRNQIHELALTEETPLLVVDFKDSRFPVALLRTCKLIQHEATPHLYQAYTFVVSNVFHNWTECYLPPRATRAGQLFMLHDTIRKFGSRGPSVS